VAWLRPIDGGYDLYRPGTDDKVGSFQCATPDEVAAAIDRARRAQKGWARFDVKARATIVQKALKRLLQNREEYLAVIDGEVGRSRTESMFMALFAAADSLNYWSRLAEKAMSDDRVGLHLLRMKTARVVHRPLGVVAVITPWNGPFQLSLNPTVQALLAGNAVIVKPSEVTPYSGGLVAKLFEGFLPEGVLQVVQGDGATGAALVNGGVDKVSFTGSVATGRKIGAACGRQLIPCTLELGGKDPAVVLDDAPLERTVSGVVFAGLMNAGQFCAGTERVYAVGDIYAPFVDELTDKMASLRLGEDIGPFISERQLDIVERHVNEAVAAGATITTGGKREGAYFKPTVLTGVTHDMALMSEETFGPILPVMRAHDEAHAIELANDCRFGLSATVWTRDKARGERVARQLNSGSVCVNDSCITYGALEVPFGGMGESGVGTTNGGVGAIRGFTHAQPILSDRFLMKREHVWHPYGPKTAEELEKALDAIFGNSVLSALVS